MHDIFYNHIVNKIIYFRVMLKFQLSYKLGQTSCRKTKYKEEANMVKDSKKKNISKPVKLILQNNKKLLVLRQSF